MSDALLGTTAIGLVVRASSLPQYPDCPRRWAARHMGRELESQGYKLHETRRNIGAATGSATHVAMGSMLQHKLDTGELGNQTEAEQKAIEFLEKDILEGANWDVTSPDLGTAQRQVAKQAKSFRLHVASKIEPVAVEKRLKATHRATGLIASGQSDMIVVRPNKLIDLKTGARGPGSNHAQYGTYTRLARTHGHQIDAIEESFVPRVRLDAEQPPPIAIPYDIEVCEATTEATLVAVARDITAFRETRRPEVFAANPSSYLCSPIFCPAHGSAWCRVGKPSRK